MKRMIYLGGLALLAVFALTGCLRSQDPDIKIVLDKDTMLGTWRISSSPVPYSYITFTEPGNFFVYSSSYENQKGTFGFEKDQIVFYIADGSQDNRVAYSYAMIDGALTLYDGEAAIMTLRLENNGYFYGNWVETEDRSYGIYPNGNALRFGPDKYDPNLVIVEDLLGWERDENTNNFKFEDEEYTLSYDGGNTLTLTPKSGVNPRVFHRP